MTTMRWLRVKYGNASITYDQDCRGGAVVKAGRKSVVIPAELLRKFADSQIDGNGHYSLGYAFGPKYRGANEYDVPTPKEILREEMGKSKSRTRPKS